MLMIRTRCRRFMPASFLLLAAWWSVAAAQEGAQPAPGAPAAATQPAVTQPAATQPAVPSAPAVQPAQANRAALDAIAANYEHLIDPEIAKLVDLSAEQQAAIEKIFSQRDAALKQAPEADHVAIQNDAIQQVDALLSDEQRSRVEALTAADTRRLRFSFRFQPWADVLNWFAQQADLSLVLDAPPPGTFNYSDNREYTVSEAIDLLNSVLLTKGYTLLRRERMLMLVDLQGGLPADLVPRIALGEIAKRGKFEMVSIAFPIEGRNADEVKNEITPLIGPHGTVSILPKTKQVLVVETAGKMKAIAAVIESIPLPEKPAPAPGAPAAPELAVFSLEGLEAKPTLEILAVLFADTKIVHDARGNQLMAQAAPEKKGAIEAVLAQLRSNPADGNGPRLEKHVVKQANRADLLETLKLTVPEATLKFDADTGELIAWAPPAAQAKIRQNIEKLGQGSQPSTDRQLEVYTLKRSDPTATLAMLQKMLPEARLAVDSTSKSIVALASPDDHKAIRATVDQLEKHGPQRPTMKVYELASEKQKRVQAMITALGGELATVRVVPDAAHGELAIWATEEQHPIVEEIVNQLKRDVSKESELRVATYRIKVADPASVLSVLQTLFPDTKFVSDPKAKQIVAWAKPADQERIKQTVEQVDADVPDDQRMQLMSHPLRSASAEAVTVVLRSVAPALVLTSDTKNASLVAWGTRQDQELVRRAIEQSQPNIPETDRSRVVVYPVFDADPAQVASMLATVFPTARFSGDRTSMKLMAWALPAEQEAIKLAVEGMAKSTTPERELTPVVYRPKTADTTYLLADLRLLVPEARLAADPKHNAIVAWATAADHEKIKATVEGLDAQGPDERGLTSVVYRPKSADVAYLLADLRTVVPEARLAADPKNNAIVAWATPADHEKIKATVEGLDAELPVDNQREVVTYQVRDTDSATLLAVLQGAAPDAKLVPDAKTGAVFAWARPEQHELLQKAVAGLKRETPEELKRVARVYRFEQGDANAALVVLRTLLPTAQLAVDARTGSLAATALPREHEEIAAMVEQMDGRGEAKDVELQVYELDTSDPSNVLTMLRDLYVQRPEVRFSLDAKSGRLAAWAQPAQHKVIREVIERVVGTGDGDDRQMEIHQLRDADPASVSWAIRNMFPAERDAKIISNDATGLLGVFARPNVQASVKAIIEQLQGHRELVEVFQLEMLDPYTAQTSIERLFGGDGSSRNKPGVPKVEMDLDGQQLMVRANKEQLRQIRELLAKMGEPGLVAQQRTPGTGDNRRMRVLPISERNLRAALVEIERVWPQLRDNPIRIVTPSAVAPTVQEDRARRAAEEAGPAESPSDPEPAPGEEGAENTVQTNPEGGCAAGNEADEPREGPLVSFGEPEADASAAQRDDQVGDDRASAEANQAAAEPAATEQPATEPPAEAGAPAKKKGAAIVIAPSGDSITISSDDPEALDQFEQLLKTFMQRNNAGGREFSIFHLKRANAVEVAETVQNVLTGGGFGFGFRGFRGGGSTVVPDPRLNAVIVQAGRNEMAMIENLIQTLDSEDAADSAVGARPVLIPVKNTSAYRIAEILRDVYKEQLTGGGNARRQQTPTIVPGSRMSGEMAALIAQINAASTGPEMSIGVDDATNSLVVAAPRNLLTEVEQLVKTLDEQSNAAKPSVKVVALKRINTKTLGKVLDNLIQERPRGRRGQ